MGRQSLQSLELVKEELTTMLKNTNGESYDDTERDSMFEQIANLANKLLEKESMSKGNKRQLEERPLPHPQQQPTPAHSNSNLPTIRQSPRNSQVSKNAQMGRNRPGPQQAPRVSLVEQAQQSSMLVAAMTWPKMEQDCFGNDLSTFGLGDVMVGMDFNNSDFGGSTPTLDTSRGDHSNNQPQKRAKHDHQHPGYAQQGRMMPTSIPRAQGANDTGFYPHYSSTQQAQSEQLRRQSFPAQQGTQLSNFGSSFQRTPPMSRPKADVSESVNAINTQYRPSSNRLTANVNPQMLTNHTQPTLQYKRSMDSYPRVSQPIDIPPRQRSRPIQPAPSTSSSTSPPQSFQQSLVKIEHKDKYTVSKPHAQRKRKYKTVWCDQCNKRPDGYRGPHELARHKGSQHQTLKIVWIIVDKSGHGWLSQCKNCSCRKTYGQDYNAVAHIRRAHFNKPSKSDTEAEKQRKLDSKDLPSMEDCRPWLRRICVDERKLRDNKYLDGSDDAIVPEPKIEDQEDDADGDECSEEEHESDEREQMAENYQDANTSVDHDASPYLELSTPFSPNPNYQMFSDFDFPPFGNDFSNYSQPESWGQFSSTGPVDTSYIPRNQTGQFTSTNIHLEHMEYTGIDPTQLINLAHPDVSQQVQIRPVFNSTFAHHHPRTGTVSESFASGDFMTDFGAISDIDGMQLFNTQQDGSVYEFPSMN